VSLRVGTRDMVEIARAPDPTVKRRPPLPSMRQSLAIAAACLGLGCATTDLSEPLGGSVWGSDAADLAVEADGATLRLLASGGCVGSYVDAAIPLTSLSFDLPGTFTQLTGAYPGRTTYPAQVAGTFRGDIMRVTVSVPSLSRVIGPLDLTRGVSHNWSACLYP